MSAYVSPGIDINHFIYKSVKFIDTLQRWSERETHSHAMVFRSPAALGSMLTFVVYQFYYYQLRLDETASSTPVTTLALNTNTNGARNNFIFALPIPNWRLRMTHSQSFWRKTKSQEKKKSFRIRASPAGLDVPGHSHLLQQTLLN